MNYDALTRHTFPPSCFPAQLRSDDSIPTDSGRGTIAGADENFELVIRDRFSSRFSGTGVYDSSDKKMRAVRFIYRVR